MTTVRTRSLFLASDSEGRRHLIVYPDGSATLNSATVRTYFTARLRLPGLYPHLTDYPVLGPWSLVVIQVEASLVPTLGEAQLSLLISSDGRRCVAVPRHRLRPGAAEALFQSMPSLTAIARVEGLLLRTASAPLPVRRYHLEGGETEVKAVPR